MTVMRMQLGSGFSEKATWLALALSAVMNLHPPFSICIGAVGTHDALLRAAIYAMTVKGDFHNGVECAQQVVQMYPNEPHPHEWLAYGLASLSRLDEAIKHYQMAARLRGGSPRLSAAWLPLNINSEMLKLLGVHPVEVSATSNGKQCNAMFIPTPCFTPLVDWRAPETLERYNQMLVVYRRISDGQWHAAFRVYFKTPSLTRSRTDWTKDALSLALSLSLAMCCSYLRIEALPIETQPLSVWISEEGKPIAVSKAGHIFWRGVKPNREFACWFIEAAHEYGHHAFPPFGPFEGGHERYSGGMTSERLNAIWLLEMLTDGSLSMPKDVDAEWLKAQLRAYVATHFTEDMLNWFNWLLSAGEQQELRRMDMSSFLGMVEFVERIYSAELLGAAMRQSGGEDVRLLLKAIDAQVRKVITAGMDVQLRCAFVLSDGDDAPSVLIAPLHDISFRAPKRIAIPLWLPEGSFVCELLAEGANFKATVYVDGVPTAVAMQSSDRACHLRFNVTVKGAWWHMLSIEFIGDGQARLKRLSVKELR